MIMPEEVTTKKVISQLGYESEIYDIYDEKAHERLNNLVIPEAPDLSNYYNKAEIDNKLNIPAIKFVFSNSGDKTFDKTASDIIHEAYYNKTTIALVSDKNSDYRGWAVYFNFAQAQIASNDCYFIKAIGFYGPSYNFYQDLYVFAFYNVDTISNVGVRWEPINSYNYYKKTYIDNKFASLPLPGSIVTPVLEADLPETPDDKVYIVYEETTN